MEQFSSGVFFVALAAVRDPALVLPTIAQALKLREHAGETLEETLANYLREKQLLLVLDNLEQVLEAAAAIAQLLAVAPELKLVATSRQPLRLSGEREYAVAPLEAEQALELFCERAQAVKHDFSLGGDRPAVEEICGRLDYLPLALELAAARVKLLPPERLLERLDSRLQLLTGGARDRDERQRTLRAAIEWSYELLSEEEQALFRRLSVFVGGSTLEAAEAVCEAELDVLASLVDKSLVRQAEVEGEPRFSMLETISEYASEHLGQSSEVEEVHRRHAAAFLALAEEARPMLDGEAQSEWLDRLEAEHENTRAALAALQRSADRGGVLRFAIALSRYWQVRGSVTEGRRVFVDALADVEGLPPSLVARALVAGCGYSHLQGDHEEGLARSREAVELAWRTGDGALEAAALGHYALGLANTGAYEDAVSALVRTVELERELGHAFEHNNALSNLAYARIMAGDLEGAAEAGEEAVVLARDRDDEWTLLGALFNRGLASLALGERERAAELFRESLGRARAAGMRVGVALNLVGLAAVTHSQGLSEAAARLVGAADRVAAEIGYVFEPLSFGCGRPSSTT